MVCPFRSQPADLFQPETKVDTLKELSDVTNMSRSRLALALQKLTMKELIKVEDQVQVELLPASEPVLEELSIAQKDYEVARFAGFNEEELIQYAYLSNRIKENICHVLKKENPPVRPKKKKKS